MTLLKCLGFLIDKHYQRNYNEPNLIKDRIIHKNSKNLVEGDLLMKALMNAFVAKFNTYFFSWGYFYFSASYFCYKQNKLKLSSLV